MSLRRILWLAMTALCLLFAPMAAEFYWINESGGLATYARVLGAARTGARASLLAAGVAIARGAAARGGLMGAGR